MNAQQRRGGFHGSRARSTDRSDSATDRKALNHFRQRLAEIGFEAQWMASNEFAERVAADIELWATLTKEAGIERQ